VVTTFYKTKAAVFDPTFSYENKKRKAFYLKAFLAFLSFSNFIFLAFCSFFLNFSNKKRAD